MATRIENRTVKRFIRIEFLLLIEAEPKKSTTYLSTVIIKCTWCRRTVKEGKIKNRGHRQIVVHICRFMYFVLKPIPRANHRHSVRTIHTATHTIDGALLFWLRPPRSLLCL